MGFCAAPTPVVSYRDARIASNRLSNISDLPKKPFMMRLWHTSKDRITSTTQRLILGLYRNLKNRLHMAKNSMAKVELHETIPQVTRGPVYRHYRSEASPTPDTTTLSPPVFIPGATNSMVSDYHNQLTEQIEPRAMEMVDLHPPVSGVNQAIQQDQEALRQGSIGRSGVSGVSGVSSQAQPSGTTYREISPVRTMGSPWAQFTASPIVRERPVEPNQGVWQSERRMRRAGLSPMQLQNGQLVPLGQEQWRVVSEEEKRELERQKQIDRARMAEELARRAREMEAIKLEKERLAQIEKTKKVMRGTASLTDL